MYSSLRPGESKQKPLSLITRNKGVKKEWSKEIYNQFSGLFPDIIMRHCTDAKCLKLILGGQYQIASL